MTKNHYPEAVDFLDKYSHADLCKIILKQKPSAIVSAGRFLDNEWEKKIKNMWGEPEFYSKCRELWHSNQKIAAIKLWREHTRDSLPKAKKAVGEL